MRATIRMAPLLLGAAVLAACGRTPPPAEAAVEELGGGLLRLAVAGPTASAAVEAGLNQATRHCAAQNGMIAVEGTRIERRGYQLRFRCLETGTPGLAAAPPQDAPAPIAAGRVAPAAAPVTGAPAPPAMPVAPQGMAPAPEPPRTGLALPGASRPLPPIAGGAPAAPPRPAALPATGPQPPSSFWQSGR